jgi:hypothetical protein
MMTWIKIIDPTRSPKRDDMKDFLRRIYYVVGRIAQWTAFIFLAVVALGALLHALDMQAEGVSVKTYIISIAALAICAAFLLPLVFFRLPKRARLASYAAVLPLLVTVMLVSGTVSDAYKLTPKGAQEAKAEAEAAALRQAQERRLEEQAQQQREKERAEQASKAQAEARSRAIAEAHRKVEQCINRRGQIPGLVEQVQSELHNPRSFEHVRTTVDTTQDQPKVMMIFRAENGFGALRLGAVKAVVTPDGCYVVDVDYDVDDF